MKIVESIDLKDLIVIISTAVTLTTAWGVFSTRVSLLEREVLSIREQERELRTLVTNIDTQVTNLAFQNKLQDTYMDQLYEQLGRPVPKRP